MKTLFHLADEFVSHSDWKTLALLKFCLCAIGIMIGLALPPKARKSALFIAAITFVATYIPLMTKLLHLATHEEILLDY